MLLCYNGRGEIHQINKTEQILKKILLAFVMILLLSITAFAVDEDEIVYDEAERTIELLNSTRKSLGLSPFVMNDLLKEMAINHSKYMNENKSFSTVEVQDKLNYKGRFPWDRANYVGYKGNYVYEFIVEDIKNFNSGLNQIINDPIKRNILFNPLYKDIGMGMENGYSSFVIGGDSNVLSRFVTYPYDGKKNVKALNASKMYNDYFENKKVDFDEYVGLPISVSYYGEKIKDVRNVNTYILDKLTDKKIKTTVLKQGENTYLENTLLIIPLEKYEHGREYEAGIEFEIELKDGLRKKYNKKINFTTENYKIVKVEEKYITRGKFTQMLVKNENYTLIEPLEFKFSDVKLNDPLSKYIYTATSLNLIQGFPSGKFEVDLNITKEQAYTILVKAFENSNYEINISDDYAIKDKYDDALEVSEWAKTYVEKAEKIGIVLTEENKLNSRSYLTESEYKKMLNKYASAKENKDSIREDKKVKINNEKKSNKKIVEKEEKIFNEKEIGTLFSDFIIKNQ